MIGDEYYVNDERVFVSEESSFTARKGTMGIGTWGLCVLYVA